MSEQHPAGSYKRRKEKTTSFDINFMRSQALYRAAQVGIVMIPLICTLKQVTCFSYSACTMQTAATWCTEYEVVLCKADYGEDDKKGLFLEGLKTYHLANRCQIMSAG